MNNLAIAVQTIKDSVSALDAAGAMGLDVDRHGRCPCPFHNGKDRNMKLYPGDRGFNCFVCHESGDVIKLARQYYGTSFPDTVRWFNDTFHLGMDIDSPANAEVVKQAENAAKRRQAERYRKEKEARDRFDRMLDAEDMVRMLEDVRDRSVPRSPNEKWNDAFCTAIEKLPEARRYALECSMDCIGRNEDA